MILVEVGYISAFNRYCSGKMKENVKGGGYRCHLQFNRNANLKKATNTVCNGEELQMNDSV
jgi:hypothetical protein